MHRKSLVLSIGVAFAAVVVTGPVASAADEWLGTWKLNLAKSKYDPPELAPKSQTLTWEAWDGGLKTIVERVDASGKPVRTEYSAKFDGKDYPWPGQANADVVTLRRGDDFYFETSWKLKDEVLINTFNLVSKDKMTLTVMEVGKDAQGRVIKHVAVYDRQ